MYAIHSKFRDTDFFSRENALTIQHQVATILGKEFRTRNGSPQNIIVDLNSVSRIMQRVFEERNESKKLMNERVVMIICNEMRTDQIQQSRNRKLEENYIVSQQLFDTTSPSNYRKGVDLKGIRLSQRYGIPCVGGTQRFVFM